jgi:hypothetical protein
MSLHSSRARQMVTSLGILGLAALTLGTSAAAGPLAAATERATLMVVTLELAADEPIADPAAEGGGEPAPDAPVEGEPSVDDPVMLPPADDLPDSAEPQKPEPETGPANAGKN